MSRFVITLAAENAFNLADQLRALADRLDRMGDITLPTPDAERSVLFEERFVGTFVCLEDQEARS
ncbi:hypothetical protein [Halomonas sp. AOP42-D1-22]|uniref:hypothetical protein n=1 Tax=Halomonas sp. AOP42-D1-22 TaxID=3457667 RepID=UPI004034DD8B